MGVLPEPILRREARTAGSEWTIFHPATAAVADRAQTRYYTILAVAGGGWAAQRGDDPDIRLTALVTIDQLGDVSRSVWPDAAAIEPGKYEEYSRRTVEYIRAKLAN